MERVFAQTDRDKLDNDVRLSTRLSLVGRWNVELQREIAEFGSELSAIQEERKRLQRCKHALKMIESIDLDVQKVRCLRMESELVRDEVEEELRNVLNFDDLQKRYILTSGYVEIFIAGIGSVCGYRYFVYKVCGPGKNAVARIEGCKATTGDRFK